MKRQEELHRISRILAIFRTQLKIQNSTGQYDMNIHAENAFIEVLNILYDCNLENINDKEGKTYPAVDLIDETNRIAFQVTSTPKLEKVEGTLKKFIEYEQYENFDKLYIFVLTKKQSKYNLPSINYEKTGDFRFDISDIIDLNDINSKLHYHKNTDKIARVREHLESEFNYLIPKSVENKQDESNDPEKKRANKWRKKLEDAALVLGLIVTIITIGAFIWDRIIKTEVNNSNDSIEHFESISYDIDESGKYRMADESQSQHDFYLTPDVDVIRAKQIIIWENNNIVALQIEWILPDGSTLKGQRFGGTGGNKSVFPISPNERIEYFKFGFRQNPDVLKNLTIISNHKKMDFGNLSEGARRKSDTIPDGYEFYGIFGSFGLAKMDEDFIVGIGVVSRKPKKMKRPAPNNVYN